MSESLSQNNGPNEQNADKDKEEPSAEEEAQLWNIAERFYEVVKDQGLWEKWWRNFGENPAELFSRKTLDQLEKEETTTRLALFATSAAHLSVTPEMIRVYFSKFPQDQKALTYVVKGADSDFFYNSNVIRFVSAIWPFLEHVSGLENTPRFAPFSFSAKAERRKLAPGVLMNGYEYVHSITKRLQAFGDAIKSYHDISQEAREMTSTFGGDHFLTTNGMFESKAYINLPPEQKSEMLRLCLAHEQYALVYEEVFNSGFTREMVERRNQSINRYDPGHSMLFRTKQSLAAYHLQDTFFDREMMSTADIGGAVEEYGLHKVLLAVLREFQNLSADKEQNTDFLIDFWMKNRNPIFANAVADALSKQNPDRAAAKLLEAIRSDTWNPAALASILYRLELGRIGISEEGVRYLEHLYDLGEYNNPDFFANRLTAKGDVGVFNKERELIGYFNLGDLTLPETHVRAEVLKITQDLLFTRREAANSDEVLLREKLMREFTKQYFFFYNDRFFDETGIRFNNLNFREQGWFLHFMNTDDKALKKRTIAFVRQYGENGLRAFLSLEYDRNMGTKILDFTDSSKDISNIEKVLGMYSALIGILDESDEEVVAIAERIAKSARDILEKAYQQRHSPEDVRKLLARNSVKGQVLLATYRFLREEKKITNISEIEGVTYETLAGSSFVQEPEAIEPLCTLYRKNYPPFTGEELAKRFRHDVEKRGAVVHRISFQGKVVAFMLEVPVGDKRVHVSALNVDPELVGAKPGVTLLNKILDLVKEGNIVEAEAVPKLAEQYSEQYGFVKIGEFNDPVDGEHLFKLELRPLVSEHVSTALRTEIDAGNKSQDR
ncbi:MAG: hypothetical protein AAB605_02505 [Patescibacteria group bacterium]